MIRLLWVAGGGALGAGLRYLVGGFIQRSSWVARLPGGWPLFPWGTFFINFSGCLAIGVLATVAEERAVLSTELRLFLLLGVLGGYTTFSSFGLETHRLLLEGSVGLALANVLGSVVLGLAGVAAGAALGRVL